MVVAVGVSILRSVWWHGKPPSKKKKVAKLMFWEENRFFCALLLAVSLMFYFLFIIIIMDSTNCILCPSGSISFQEFWRKSAIKIRGPFYNSGRRHGPVWDTIFVVSCAVGFIVDPLFLYIWNINDDGKCLKADKKLQTPFLALRCLVDIFYIVDYVRTLSRRRAYEAFWVTVCYRFIEAFYIAFPFPQVIY